MSRCNARITGAPSTGSIMPIAIVFIFAFQQRDGADGGRYWPTIVLPAELDAERAGELPGRSRSPPAPPIRHYGSPPCSRLGFQAGAVVLFIHWRVAAERRGGAGDFVFYDCGRRWPRPPS
jgi:hypothetical protein